MILNPTRRALLELLGTAGVVGSIGTASARPPDQDVAALHLFSEQAVGGATEVVTQESLAYVATSDGLAVVDWHNPGRPEKIVDMDVPGSGVWDVKVDGALLAISSQAGETDDDIGDPTDPEFLGTWVELPAGVHNHFLDGDVAYICREFPFDDSALKIVDVSDPTAPVEVSAMGEAPDADEDVAFPSAEWVQRALLPPGNSHYVQPSPDGDVVLQGTETFPRSERSERAGTTAGSLMCRNVR